MLRPCGLDSPWLKRSCVLDTFQKPILPIIKLDEYNATLQTTGEIILPALFLPTYTSSACLAFILNGTIRSFSLEGPSDRLPDPDPDPGRLPYPDFEASPEANRLGNENVS